MVRNFELYLPPIHNDMFSEGSHLAGTSARTLNAIAAVCRSRPMSLPLTIIVAATKNNGIGQNGTLPWRLPKEMAYFARVTSNAPEGKRNTVMMGRTSWESIPPKFRPLANRANIVVTRNAEYDLGPEKPQAPTLRVLGLDNAFDALTSIPDVHRHFVIGGASLYEQVLQLETAPALVDRILLTRVLSPDLACDTCLADFTSNPVWQRASHRSLSDWVGFDVPEGVQEEKGIQYEFQMWVRAGDAGQ